MANPNDKRMPPLSIRLTFAERALLEEKAGGKSLSSYVKDQVFAGSSGGPSLGPGLSIGSGTRRARPDTRLLAQILAKLGETNLAVGMDELAQAASIGVLYVDEGVRQQLVQACEDIAEIRLLLLEALGKRRQPVLPKPRNTTEAFNLAASGMLKPRLRELGP